MTKPKQHPLLPFSLPLIAAGAVLTVAFFLLDAQFGERLPLWPTRFALEVFGLALLFVLFARAFNFQVSSSLRGGLVAAFWATLLLFVYHLSRMELTEAALFLHNTQQQLSFEAMLLCVLLYLLLLAVPFVPGIELGLLIMAVFGRDSVVFVYLATIGGLTLAYSIGQLFPYLWKQSLFTTPEAPLPLSQEASKASGSPTEGLSKRPRFFSRFLPWFLRFRYLALAALINMPGNAVFGGGGGISFLCGVSRRFGWLGFVATVALATLPVPILVYFGLMELEMLLGHYQ